MPFRLTRRSLLPAPLVLSAAALARPPSLDPRAMLDLLRQPGSLAFMRHALAPFEGAPRETFVEAETLGPCETQRNLNDVGRADARRIGDLFRREGVAFDRVYTSLWCRCRETAELIVGGPVPVLPEINSYWTSRDRDAKGAAQLERLKRYLNERTLREARVLLVTHGSLITHLSDYDTQEAEIVVMKADGRGGLVSLGHGVV